MAAPGGRAPLGARLRRPSRPHAAALAAARPSTLDALSEIPGIGPAKLEAYGKDLLALLGAESA